MNTENVGGGGGVKLPSTEQPNAKTVTERLTIHTKTPLTTASAGAVMPHKLVLSSFARSLRSLATR